MSSDNFEDWLLLVAESIDRNSEIMHFGVKGMKWGVRKDRPQYEMRTLGPDHIQVTTKYGETLDLVKNKPSALTKYIAKNNKRFAESESRNAIIQIKNSSGKRVGDASMNLRKDKQTGKDDLYLNWVGIDSKQRGKGYASAVLEASEKFGRSTGVDRMLLEVPGNSPDARHIYAKMGFESTNRFFGHKGDLWGGLEEMEYRFDKVKHSGDSSELQHFGIKGMKWGRRRADSNGDGRVDGAAKVPGASEDFTSATAAKTKAKTFGTHTLSNKELQEVVTRENLMRQYAQLNPREKSKGEKVVEGIQTTVKYAQQAQQMYNSPVGKMLRAELKKTKS